MEKVEVPQHIIEEAEIASSKLLPSKSKGAYEKEYQNFLTWQMENGVSGITEEIMMAYFHILRKTCASSSTWTKYSMLKSTIRLNKNVDISKYGKLIAYLKSESRTHKAKKARILEKEHIEEFLEKAPDSQHLMTKVALLMGIYGACRCQELTNMKTDDIEDKGGYLLVSVPDTKTYKPRKFTVIEEGCVVNPLELYRKYISLRPSNVSHRRLFLNFKNQKCTVQAVGINTLSKIPSQVATYLNLPEPGSYTGHSLRRSSATLLVNGGGDITTLKRHGGWRSNTVAEGYIEDSINEKINNAKKIRGAISEKTETNNVLASTSTSNAPETRLHGEVHGNEGNLVNDLEVSQCKSFKFNININLNVNVNKK